jgi:hypothetical protein
VGRQGDRDRGRGQGQGTGGCTWKEGKGPRAAMISRIGVHSRFLEVSRLSFCVFSQTTLSLEAVKTSSCSRQLLASLSREQKKTYL